MWVPVLWTKVRLKVAVSVIPDERVMLSVEQAGNACHSCIWNRLEMLSYCRMVGKVNCLALLAKSHLGRYASADIGSTTKCTSSMTESRAEKHNGKNRQYIHVQVGGMESPCHTENVENAACMRIKLAIYCVWRTSREYIIRVCE